MFAGITRFTDAFSELSLGTPALGTPSSMESDTSTKEIRVFCDKGADVTSAENLKLTAQKLLPGRKIELVNAHTLQTTDWDNDTEALFMGGGKASEMETTLGQDGLKKIFNAVYNKKVKVFAVCGSAYMLSKSRAFVGSGRGIITSKYPLFAGKAWGPVLGSSLSSSNPFHASCARACTLQITGSEEKGKAYGLSAPTFTLPKIHPGIADPKIRVLANFMDNGHPEPAVISINDNVVFCGPHLEYSWYKDMQLGATDIHFSDLVSKLHSQETFRKKLCQMIFQSLHLIKKKA
jgi:glutamine amidotransferase-like uncharacterized protein